MQEKRAGLELGFSDGLNDFGNGIGYG